MTRNRPKLGLGPDEIKALEKPLSKSPAPHLEQVLQARVSRRDTLRGGFGLAVTTIFAGAGLSACGGDSDGGSTASEAPNANLNFNAVAGSSADRVVVPDGYATQVLIPWGTPLLAGAAAFAPDGNNSAAEQALQVGQNHDGMTFFPLPENSANSERGLLAVNHEYTNGTLFGPDGRAEEEIAPDTFAPTDADQVRKDINAHGVTVVELQRDDQGVWTPVQGGFNRRFTAATPAVLSGPAAGSPLMVTAYDNSGTTSRGTVNNCGRGFTPWGTYLTCEENIQGYLITNEDPVPDAKARYGLSATGFGYLWSNVAGDPTEADGEFARFDTTPTGADANSDYRNEANTFGWIVEIDPFNPNAPPVKRTAMGRFRHEGAEPGRIVEGRPIAFYMGDDARGEYMYKFVTADAWDPTQPNPNMLDNGTLFVARLNEDGSGEWLPLDTGNPDLAGFADQAEILVYARLAADAVGATPMDRPEWSTTDPTTGEIYFTLTNNTDRGNDGEEQPGPANPRANNTHGHVIRLAESGDNPAATTFNWDIFVFGANAGADPDFNRSGLTLDNEFGGPDGLWFDDRGVLWIQTDNGAELDSGTNDQMLAVIPADLKADDNPIVNPDNQASLKRFFVGPVGCEVTGVAMTPDNRSMFVNIQHPGEHWPERGNSTPRSATVVITRSDGGEIAL